MHAGGHVGGVHILCKNSITRVRSMFRAYGNITTRVQAYLRRFETSG